MEQIILTGKTVRLVPLEKGHLEPLFLASRPAEIWEWSASKILTYEDAAAYIENGIQAREQKIHYPFAVFHQETGELIGSTSLRSIDSHNESLEIGSTWYRPDHWRTSVNTECKYLLLRHAFEHMHMNRVEFRTDERNDRSRKAIARLGAVQEGILRRQKKISGGYIRNTVIFSILADEWPQVKERLQALLRF